MWDAPARFRLFWLTALTLVHVHGRWYREFMPKAHTNLVEHDPSLTVDEQIGQVGAPLVAW